MKKFVLYVLFVILGVIMIDFCFGIIMRSTLRATIKGDWGRRNYIVNTSTEDLLIFGGSRAVHHYNTEILSDSLQMSCYNCGEDGNGIMVHLPRFKKILQRYCPKVVIYEIAPTYDFTVYDNTSFLKLLRPYSDDTFVKEVIHDIDKSELLKLHLNLYKYNSTFVEIFAHRLSSFPETADQFTYSPLMSEIAYEPKESDLILGGNNVDELKLKYLNEFVDLCNSKGINLFIAASPWYKMKEQDAYGPICKLCKEKNVPFLNHNFENSYNMNKVYFNDAAHMNKYGAETYTKQIAHEIKEILKKPQHR